MGEKLKFTNLVTTQRRLPELEKAAQKAGGTYTTEYVPARGRAPEYILFHYIGDILTLRREIFKSDRQALKSKSQTE